MIKDKKYIDFVNLGAESYFLVRMGYHMDELPKMNKTFAVKKYGSIDSAMQAARACRNEYAKKYKINIYSSETKRVKNTKPVGDVPVVGVSSNSKTAIRSNGDVYTYTSYVVNWVEYNNGVRRVRTKHFGYDESSEKQRIKAFDDAVKMRKRMEAEHYKKPYVLPSDSRD